MMRAGVDLSGAEAGAGAVRLVLTARDQGAVGHMLALAGRAGLFGFDVCIVAEGVAQRHLAAHEIPHAEAAAWLDETSAAVSGEDRIAKAAERLQRHGAQAVVCGRSAGNDVGIDRLVILAARRLGIPSVVIQDFWGDVESEAFAPDHYFVLDEQAELLTRRRSSATVHTVGSPRHLGYREVDFTALRAVHRAALDLSLDEPVIGYFGQGLMHLEGYRQVLRDLAEAVEALGRPALLYRPHPRETPESCRETRALLDRRKGLRGVWAGHVAVEAAMAVADVVVSCFSTVSLDAAQMMLRPGSPEVAIVCADYPGDVSGFWRPATGLSEFPMVSKGIALGAHDRESLQAALRKTLDPQERARQSVAARASLHDAFASVEAAYRLLQEIVAAR